MIKNKWIPVAIVGLLFSGCAPADIDYCRSFGVEGTAEYGKCLYYYHQQDTRFKADLSVCNLEADGTYPPTLYDYGHTEHVVGGYGPYGHYYGGGFVNVPPDYAHNAQVDSLRMRIIGPCMDAHGWNSPTDWQAGRHAVRTQMPPKSQKLPWQKKDMVQMQPNGSGLPW